MVRESYQVGERIAAEYHAARTGVVAVLQAEHGRLRAAGRDRIDLLQRMSTNDLNGMAPGEARPTVLTTPLARIVDLMWVLNGPDAALLLASDGRGEAVRQWLGRHIFFQDEVTLKNLAPEFGQFSLYGPEAGRMAGALLDGAAGLEPGRFVQGGDLVVLRTQPSRGEAWTILGPAAQVAQLLEDAVGQGAVKASNEAYEVLRIEAGLPGAGHELTDGYIPLEANLWHAVSFKKGCYIGQEIIARMESRGRLAKTLVGLKTAARVEPGAEVRSDSGIIGTVTSAAVSPANGPIALAFVKPAQAVAGLPVTAGGVEAEIVELPFA